MFAVKKVRLFGRTGGAFSAQSFVVEVWDKDREVLYSSNHSIFKFSTSPAWVEIDIPNVEIKERFYIHVFTGTGNLGGIFIGADDSVSNEHSSITVREGGITRESSTWGYRSDMWFSDKSKVNWMIRAVGIGSASSAAVIVRDAQDLPSGYILEKKSCYQDDRIEIFDITYVSEGLKVRGYLAQPIAPGLYPAVIWNRGGNLDFSMLQPDNLKPYAENGYVAIGSQYRGSPGSEGMEEFGGADVDDVLNLIFSLKSLPNVDIDKIGMVGFSRGGMMTYLALKEQTLRGFNYIKAACTIGGNADLFMSAKERPDMLTGVFVPLIGGTPSEVPEKYEERSATYWVDKINVPLLIQHGEADVRCSVEQSRKLAQELAKQGKVYKLITYPEDDHPLTKNNGGLAEIFQWLGQHLK